MTMSDRNTQLEKAIIGLRSLVLGGEVAANERLPEVTLAERLGLSRTPLRQAMDRLVAEGLLERIETGGCRVASFTLEDIGDAIELRGVVEGTAARIAAERGADPGVLAEARLAVERIDVALARPGGPDFDAYVAENAVFHRCIAEMAGSAILKRETQRISRLPLASPSAFLKDQELIPDFSRSLTVAQEQHRALLDAIERREGARAEALAREHARIARRNLDHLAGAGPGVASRVPGLSLVSPE